MPADCAARSRGSPIALSDEFRFVVRSGGFGGGRSASRPSVSFSGQCVPSSKTENTLLVPGRVANRVLHCSTPTPPRTQQLLTGIHRPQREDSTGSGNRNRCPDAQPVAAPVAGQRYEESRTNLVPWLSAYASNTRFRADPKPRVSRSETQSGTGPRQSLYQAVRRQRCDRSDRPRQSVPHVKIMHVRRAIHTARSIARTYA